MIHISNQGIDMSPKTTTKKTPCGNCGCSLYRSGESNLNCGVKIRATYPYPAICPDYKPDTMELVVALNEPGGVP